MDKQIKTRRGGPRTFDRDQAVEIAMRLFWQRGYEGVGISDLTAAIGIAPPSLYSAFGNKAGLYREALDRYERLPGALDGLNGATSLNEALEGLLKAAIDACTRFADEPGCMVSIGLLQCAGEHQELAVDLMHRRAAIRDAIAQSLGRWVPMPRAQALASYCSTLLQGIAVMARDGAEQQELQQVADVAISGLALEPQHV